MKLLSLILLVLLGISCGGMNLQKKQVKLKKTVIQSPIIQNIEKLVHLKILEAKYLQENKSMNLAITRGMIMEIGTDNTTLPDAVTAPDLKKLRKNNAFLSLEMTIEHLSHREQFKLGTRHSAFHKRP